MNTEQDKAVALAICYDGGLRQDGMFLFVNQERFWHFCQAYRHQVIEELANKAGVMPYVANQAVVGGVCRADDVREAFATMQAKVEQERRMFDRLNQIAGENERKLEQAQARSAELEKDAARVHTYKNQPTDNVIAWRFGEAAQAAKPGGDLIDHGLSLLQKLQEHGYGIVAIDAAMKGQQP